MHERLTQHIRYGLRLCPSGHCSRRSQRRICWRRYPKLLRYTLATSDNTPFAAGAQIAGATSQSADTLAEISIIDIKEEICRI